MKYFVLCILFVLLSCGHSKTTTKDVTQLQEAFTHKNEQLFLEQFPEDYEMFVSYFGFEQGTENNANVYAPLYEESYDYIAYWFSLLEKPEYQAYEQQLISICTNALWQVDGVNYFQDQALDYIKENKKYDLVNNLTDDEAQVVLSMLFGGPYQASETTFIEHLSSSKKQLLLEILREECRPLRLGKAFSFYQENDAYFIEDIDINGDGVLDKVVCHKPYEGEALLLFLKADSDYELALYTTNFSEDGGNQVKNIMATENGIVVNTYFPDGGLSEAAHYVGTNAENKWLLFNSIYKSRSSNEIDAFVYICEVDQNIPLDDFEALEFIKDIPVEGKRDMVCYKEEDIGKKALPLHGSLTPKKVNLYYPKLLQELGNEGVVYAEPLKIDTKNGIIPTLLTYTTTVTDFFIYTHNSKLEVIDDFYVGTSTDFDNGTSETIDYEYLENDRILLKKTNWGYADKDHTTIDTLALERTFVEISEEGDIHYDISKDEHFYSLELYTNNTSGRDTAVRKSPEGEIVIRLRKEDVHIVTVSRAVNGWFKVINLQNAEVDQNITLPDGVGWIHHSVLGAHTRETIYLMAQPEKGSIIGTVLGETEIKILDKKNDWVRISYGDINGWIKADALCGNPFTTCP